MNLAEFPLATLADRPPAGCKTLVFEDEIWDKGRREQVTRRLTVSASDKYGLPTALDDEVILGLIQLTRSKRFETRQVFFSRYQLIQLLGWRDEGKSYTRLQKSLKRWLGVTLYYDNAWWDKAQEKWVDEHFHLLERVVLYRGKVKTGTDQAELALSSFTWNERVFCSFQAGYLKKLDMNLYRALRLPAAKRMYRFLDKKFYFSSRLVFDLMQFAHEHIGFSRNYDAAQLKRRLAPAIRELETAGFLVPREPTDRYRKIRRGIWEVVFERQRTPKPDKASPSAAGSLEGRLAKHGVSTAVASRLVREYPSKRIDEKLRGLEHLRRQRGAAMPKNPAGYLVEAIRNDYQIHAMSVKASRISPVDLHAGPPAIGTKAPRRACDALAKKREAAEKQIEEYIQGLSVEERKRLEASAMAEASPLVKDACLRVNKAGKMNLLEEYQKALLAAHVRKTKVLAPEKSPAKT